VVSARPDPFKVHVADQVLAVLAEAAPMPLSTPQIQDRTGYGQLVWQVLTRLAAAGEVEKVTARAKPCYWRTLATQVSLPPMTVCGDRDRRRPS
jgi:hypothetical protein